MLRLSTSNMKKQYSKEKQRVLHLISIIEKADDFKADDEIRELNKILESHGFTWMWKRPKVWESEKIIIVKDNK